MKKYLIITWSICAVIYSKAQEPDIKKDISGLSVEELINIKVVTASLKEEVLADAPATIYVVTENQIQIRGYTNLEEVLEDIPEIEIQRKSSGEYSNYISFRGIVGNEKFIILMDGIRINSTTGTPHAITHNYPVANAKRIEVILGPASALYGADAFSGIINIITKTGVEAKGINGNFSYGNFNTTDNSFIAGVGNEEISFSITGKYYHSDEPNLADIYKDDYAWYHNEYKTNGYVRLAPSDPDVYIQTDIIEYETPTNAYFINAKLSFKNFEVGYFRNYESHCNSISVLPDYSIYSKDAVYNTALELMHATHSYTSKNSKLRIKSTISRGTYDLLPESKFLNNFTSYQYGYKYETNNSIKLEEQFDYKLSEKSSIIAGFSFEDVNALPKSGDLPFKYDVNKAANLQDIYYIGTNILDGDSIDLTIYQDFYYLQYQNTGAYAQFQTKFAEKIALTLGARYDNSTRYGSSFNPRIGLVVTPLEKIKIKLLYGTAFLAPSPYKAYQHFGSFIPVTDTVTNEVTGLFGSFWHLSNPELKPEKLCSFEGSFSYFLNNNIAISLNGYYNDISELIVNEYLSDQEFKGISVALVEKPKNEGNSYTMGGTFKVNAMYKFGSITTNSYLAYSYSDGKIKDIYIDPTRTSEDVPIPYSAMHTVKAGIDVSIGKTSFSPRLIYRTESKHASLRDVNGDLLTNEAFALVNLAARYQIADSDSFKFAVFMKVTNLLNSEYYNVCDGGSTCLSATPQDPIRINFGINVQL